MSKFAWHPRLDAAAGVGPDAQTRVAHLTQMPVNTRAPRTAAAYRRSSRGIRTGRLSALSGFGRRRGAS